MLLRMSLGGFSDPRALDGLGRFMGLEPLGLHGLRRFLHQVNGKPFSEITSSSFYREVLDSLNNLATPWLLNTNFGHRKAPGAGNSRSVPSTLCLSFYESTRLKQE